MIIDIAQDFQIRFRKVFRQIGEALSYSFISDDTDPPERLDRKRSPKKPSVKSKASVHLSVAVEQHR